MRQYMIEIHLPEIPDEEFVSLIPKQVDEVNKLLTEDVITSYTLTTDKSRLWTTIKADTEEEVENILSSFPLIDWMQFEIYELMFHQESSSFIIPRMSLN